MQIEQKKFSQHIGWQTIKEFTSKHSPQFVLVFGSVELFKNETIIDEIKNQYSNSILIGCTTSGNIISTFVDDKSIVTTAVYLEKSSIVSTTLKIENMEDSFDVGKELINNLSKEKLKHVFILSDGLHVNGSQLVKGMQSVLPKNVTVTGGLAGDADLFQETYILLADGTVNEKCITALGIYGDHFKVGYGSYGGWDIFGVERMVTKSKDNILYEIDNSPALTLYKSFLGEQSKELPASALLFPLSLRISADEESVVRTILGIDETTQSLTFAGDIPEGSHVKLMKSNVDRLIDGAIIAAERAKKTIENIEIELAVLVSCVGRKLVMKQLVEEEIEGVQSVLGENVALTGFYSYGEIAPFSQQEKCTLHNQTMTVTVFSEK